MVIYYMCIIRKLQWRYG